MQNSCVLMVRNKSDTNLQFYFYFWELSLLMSSVDNCPEQQARCSEMLLWWRAKIAKNKPFTAVSHADACSNFEKFSNSGTKKFWDHFFLKNNDLTLTWRFATCLCSESTIHLRHGWPKPRKTPQNAFKTLLLLLKYSWLRDNHKSTESKKNQNFFNFTV